MRQIHIASCPTCGDTQQFAQWEWCDMEAWEYDHAQRHEQQRYERKQRESDESQ